MPLDIYFFGLIAHVQVENTNVTRAVLVDGHGHSPVIFIPAAANPRLSDPHAPPSTFDSYGNLALGIKNWNVHIAGVADVQTTRATNFDTHVVALTSCLIDSDPMKKRINQRVHRKEHIANGTFSYFDYQGGTIETFTCYDEAATFANHQQSDPECVAHSTKYSITLPDPVVLTVSNGPRQETVTIDANSAILVFNFAPGHGHFPEFRDITDATDIRRPAPNPDRRCHSCVPVDARSVQAGEKAVMLPVDLQTFLEPFGPGTVECTQTRYP
ncbi:MAG TPA: hypothetical protein VEK11_00450 [Thermoanaerobaculia bacterium]|nr:hypothetical protein [Thermoanaerobaculia bacterium]